MLSHDTYKDVEDFFASPPSANEKAWGMIHDFYHMMLTYMEEQGISKADLAKRLGRSRSAITQMFQKTPNITVKKMVEIADAIGVDVQLNSPQMPRSEAQTSPSVVYRMSTQEFSPAIHDDPSRQWNVHRVIAWTYQREEVENIEHTTRQTT